MNVRTAYLLFSLVFFYSIPLLSAATEKEKPRKLPITFNASVDYIVDGDSIRVWLTDEEALFLISVYGIDSPELPQPYGNKARKFLEKTLKGKDLKVTIVQTGQYQTGLGYFEVDGKDLGTIMVTNGFAEVDQKTIRRFRDSKEMEAMLLVEKRAREEKLGMWVQGDDYESPVSYMLRTKKKQKKAGGKH